MKKRSVSALALLVLCVGCAASAEKPTRTITLQGIIREQSAAVKSLDAWNAPGDPYYILETSDGGHQVLRPSSTVGMTDLQKLTGYAVRLKGHRTVGERPSPLLENITAQVPIEAKLAVNPEGEIVSSGWQVMKRGAGIVVRAIAKVRPTGLMVPGAVSDYEWAHASNRLALLSVDQQQHGTIMVLDAQGEAAVATIAIPDSYRPSCFAWLPDDSGFLLAMAKPEKADDFAEDNFYRYTFAGRQFEGVYATIERQYADIFSIEIDSGSGFWAAASVGEGHPDLAIYQDGATVLTTDVFPGSITPLFWQNHRLWAVTEAYLEYGHTRTQRARHPHFGTQNPPQRDWGDVVAYLIDPLTKAAHPNSAGMAALETAMRSSYDQRYRVGLTHNTGSSTLNIMELKQPTH